MNRQSCPPIPIRHCHSYPTIERSLHSRSRYLNRAGCVQTAGIDAITMARGRLGCLETAFVRYQLRARRQRNLEIVDCETAWDRPISTSGSPASRRARASFRWCGVSFGLRPIRTPRAWRARPSPVLVRINSRSNSAKPASTVNISRPWSVVVSAQVSRRERKPATLSATREWFPEWGVLRCWFPQSTS